jgi:hypothetical protein
VKEESGDEGMRGREGREIVWEIVWRERRESR